MATALHAHFRMAGWRWPFRLGDVLEVWRDDQLVGEISVELLTGLITHYLVGHDLLRQFDAAIVPAAVGGPQRPLVKQARAVHDRNYRAELRARRRSRATRPVAGDSVVTLTDRL